MKSIRNLRLLLVLLIAISTGGLPLIASAQGEPSRVAMIQQVERRQTGTYLI